jgi:predicted metal-binding membrane protein
MGNGPGTMGMGLAAFMPMWVAMMAAMMLPAIAPLGSMYLRSARTNSRGVTSNLHVVSLTAGYLAVWAAFGVAAFASARVTGHVARHHPRGALYVGAGIFAVAGIYQLSPLKDACLKHCRSPLAFLLHFGNYKGRTRDVRVGITHGTFCLGCCAGLMVILLAVGVMNVAWMVGLAVVIFLEKTWRFGKGFGIAFGIALIVLAVIVPSHPGLIPGLHLVPTSSMQMAG